jgi:hypothetical protein
VGAVLGRGAEHRARNWYGGLPKQDSDWTRHNVSQLVHATFSTADVLRNVGWGMGSVVVKLQVLGHRDWATKKLCVHQVHELCGAGWFEAVLYGVVEAGSAEVGPNTAGCPGNSSCCDRAVG